MIFYQGDKASNSFMQYLEAIHQILTRLKNGNNIFSMYGLAASMRTVNIFCLFGYIR